MSLPIVPATPADLPALEALLNLTYRGDGARQGWTHESDLIAGDVRTDQTTLAGHMATPGAVFLKYQPAGQALSGCVYLEKQAHLLYLGMLSVDPALQAHGIGKQLLAAAERHARQLGCTGIVMRVISARTELLAWYGRHGYQPTGQTEPFLVDPKYGQPRQPLEFVVLHKAVN